MCPRKPVPHFDLPSNFDWGGGMPPTDEVWAIAEDLSTEQVMELLRRSIRWVPATSGYECLTSDFGVSIRTTERRKHAGPPDVFGEIQVHVERHSVAYYRDKVREGSIFRLLVRLREVHGTAVKAQHRIYAGELERQQEARARERESAIQALRSKLGFKKTN